MPLPRASDVVIREILSMYSDILAFLYSVVKLNTIFCFNLLQDQEALDRIVLLFSLEASLAGKVLLLLGNVFELGGMTKRRQYTLFRNFSP